MECFVPLSNRCWIWDGSDEKINFLNRCWIRDESDEKINFLHFKRHTTPVSKISSYLQTGKRLGIQKNSKSTKKIIQLIHGPGRIQLTTLRDDTSL